MKFAIALVLVVTASAQAQQPVQQEPEDSVIFTKTIARAQREHLDTLPIGDVVVRVGKWFVGTKYTPNTLEQPGPEHLVVNLRTFDCETYIENMLTFARVIKMKRSDFGTFKRELAKIRYRNSKLDGYPSRLHYFSEWIANNAAKGIVVDEAKRLGVIDPEPIDFMSTHRSSYKQLANDDAFITQIVATEKRINQAPRYMIPEARIADVEKSIHDGDLIGATSNLKGLDVAHTGIALWMNGRLHFMHAPLVGDSVQISPNPLADRIATIKGQDGIMVARPLEPRR